LTRGRRSHPAWIRAAFVASALVGGLGVLVYLACWLIIPQEGEQEGELGSSWVVVLAQACAVCVGVATLGALGAAATLFGFGWIVAALAAAVLLGVLGCWPRLGPAWALLPIAALTLPSLAAATSGVGLPAGAERDRARNRAGRCGHDARRSSTHRAAGVGHGRVARGGRHAVHDR